MSGVPFRNSILAGEDLIRTAMRSPNYVAGASGWRIAKDGSAEFNNVVVRGKLITGAPGAKRVEIGNVGADLTKINFFSGEAAEDLPANITMNNADDSLLMSSPVMDGVNFSLIRLKADGTMVLDTSADRIIDGLGAHIHGAPSWIYPALQNGWVNYGVFQEARYCKVNGVVYIEGLIKNGFIGARAFNLAGGYRPGATLLIPGVDGTNVGYRLDIGAGGDVVPSAGNNGYWSVACSFVASN